MDKIKVGFLTAAICILALAACSKPAKTVEYDAELCAVLVLKIDNHDVLTNEDYADIIDQSISLTNYYYERIEPIAALADNNDQERAMRELCANPEFVQRTTYLLRFESTLNDASAAGKLQRPKADAYDRLLSLEQQYMNRLNQLSDQAE